MTGKLYAVGVGPGDPGLLTVKALKAIRESHVIAVPKGRASSRSLALAAISEFIEDQEIMELVFPMVDDAGFLQESWDEAARIIGSRLSEGKTVVFATLGDPSLYSTSTYLLDSLRRVYCNNMIVEIIPGINSFSAAASLFQIPLAEGEESLAVVTAPGCVLRLKEVLNLFETVVILKANRCFDQIMDVLEEMGLADNGYFVSRCSCQNEYSTRDLKALAGKEIDYFSLLMVRRQE